jgi:N-acetylglucosaminyl-diphospho-decaprenol L-rhamnosyltransferase
MPTQAATRLSIVVVTHNSQDAVGASLPRLRDQLEPDDELIVVDNASSDDTVARVHELAPAARVIQSARNAGFAAGANVGAREASGDLLVFLNPDATPAPGFAAAIRRAEPGWSAWMGLVTADCGTRVNTSGGVVHFTGIAWAGEAGRHVDAAAAAAPAGPRETAFLSGACLAVPRADWERLGGFAYAYFMYQEDVDLSLRIRLAGGRLGVQPAAVVDHDYTFVKGPMKWRLLERNRWATIVRCYPGPLLLLLAPALAAAEAALLAVAAKGGWLPQKLVAAGETVRALPRLLRERRAIQATRAVSSAEFAAWLTADLDSPFLGRAGRVTPLRWALRAYWRLVIGVLRSPVTPR